MTRWLVVLLAACVLAGTGVPSAAAVTGELDGIVIDAASGKPVAGAQITAASPSQIAVTTSDASGHFAFVALSPDTYVISGEAVSYDPFEVPGVTVISGRSVSVALKALPAPVKVEPPIPAAVPVELVKPGSTAGASTVDPVQQHAVRSLGGGVNANNAYSGIASVPGAAVPFGGAGPNQPVYTHGSLPGQIGYSEAGVPVNRAYDNAPSNTLSTLGQQSLQVQNAAVNANSPTSGIAGVIEQTIRTGTDPAYESLTLGIGAPAFYHGTGVEAGGTNASRTFSYYAGYEGFNTSLRSFDQFNGGDGGLGNALNLNGNPTNVATAYAGGVYPACIPSAAGPVNPLGLSPGQQGYIPPGTGGNQGCLNVNQVPNNLGALATIADREGLVNLHFGIPRTNGYKDDLQVLYDVSFVNQRYYDSLGDYTPNTLTQYLAPYYPLFGGSAPAIHYADGYTLGIVPFGTPAANVSAQPYYFPNTSGAFNAPIPATQQDGQNSNFSLLKLQYQHVFAPNLYARGYYYTLYSDLLTSGPVFAGLNASTLGFGALAMPVLPDYELSSHTQGGSMQLGWQIDEQNLASFAFNVSTASVMSLNNQTFGSGLSTGATSLTDGVDCYDVHTGALESCYAVSGSGVPLSGGTIGSPIPTSNGVPVPIIGAAAKANASYLTTFDGYSGTFNGVRPLFLNASLSDDFHPSGKLDINVGIRFEQYQYALSDSNAPGYGFWFNQAANTFCYNLVTKQPLFAPPVKGQTVFSPVLEQGFNNTCGVAAGVGQSSPTGRVDPATGDPVGNPNGLTYNGYTTALFTNAGPSSTASNVFEPRIGATYAVSPDTLISGAAGKYAQPYNSGAAQYLDLAAKSAAAYDFAYFWGQGYTSPDHIFSPTTSYNLDLALSQHIKNTDVWLKFAPFYRYARNVFQDTPAGPGMTAQVPSGDETAYGFDLQLRKGDPARNGFSGLLNYAYTYSFFKFNPLPNGLTLGDGLNVAVDQYNALTAAGNREGQKGAPCYVGGVAASSAFCVIGSNGQPVLTPAGAAYTDPEGNRVVVNPYYDQPAQGYFNSTGPYPVYGLFPGEDDALGGTSGALSSVNPHVFSGFLNYRRNRFSVTPTFQLQSGANGAMGGARYGSPFSTIGVDPRSCSGNQTGVPTAPNPGLPNYITCGASPAQYGVLYIPDPYTGRFDGPGDFLQPWYFDFNAQFTYNLTSRARATLILANIYQTCFGGTKAPWATAYPASALACNYNANPSQVSNFYNGSGPRDTAANGVLPIGQSLYPYQPYSNNVYPFQMNLQLQFKL